MNRHIADDLQTIILLDGLSSQYEEIKAVFNTNELPTMKTLRSRLFELQISSESTENKALKARNGKKIQ